MFVILFIISAEAGLTFSVFMVPIGILILFDFRNGRKYAMKIPKGSRGKEGLDDISVLKTILKHAECPNCDGNIDLSGVEEDRIYHCGYCGATGIVEIVHTQ